MIRVAIDADALLARDGLAELIRGEPGMQLVAAGDLTAEGADIVLHAAAWLAGRDDAPSFDAGDLDAAERAPSVILLLEHIAGDVVRDAYAAGASGVIAANAGDDEVVAAIRAVAAGLTVLPAAVSSMLLGRFREPAADASVSTAAPAPLTPREREVLALLAQGLPNKAIAPRLGISEHTVKTHIAAIYDKLHARNRAEAVVAAARQGLVLL